MIAKYGLRSGNGRLGVNFISMRKLPSDKAQCTACGEVRPKEQMVHDPVYGWFCTQYELTHGYLEKSG